MIISDKFKLLFVHIPKTGGGTVYNIIKSLDPRIKSLGSTHKGINNEEAKKYRDYFKFAFIRNPYTIQVSNYRWRLRGNNFPEKTPLIDFVTEKVDNNSCKNQFKYIMPKDNILVDFIGKYEYLEASINFVLNVIKVPRISLDNFAKIHFIGAYNWKDYYNEETKRKVYEFCKRDFQLGGYPE